MRVFLLGVVGIVACGSSSSTSDAGLDSSSAVHVPKVHRASSNPCTEPRPATQVPTGVPNAPCTKDADCTTGKNGRCVSLTAGNVKCSYDECTMDSECGASSVCNCRESTNAFANTCQHGNCKTDADCSGGYCSPSGIELDPYCRMGIPLGSFGFFCHTPKDACTDDADCPMAGSFPSTCVFDAMQAKWACMAMMCVD